MQVILDPEHLIDFLNALRVVGFDVSTQQHIAAQNLLITLAASGRLPDDPHDLRTLLGPIVCSSPRDQENFYRYFDQWIKQNPLIANQTESKPVAAAVHKPRYRWSNYFRLLIWACSLVLITGLITAAYFLVRARPQTVIGTVLDSDSNNPLSGAKISYSNEVLASDNSGQFSITYKRDELPITIRVEATEHETAQQVIDTNTQSPLTIRLLHLADSAEQVNANPRPNATVTPTAEAAEVEIGVAPLPSPTPTPEKKLRDLAGYSWAILPLMLFVVWWLWRSRLNRALLHKLQRVGEPRLDRLVVERGANQLFQEPSFRRTIQELRRHRQRGASELDVHRTVSKTIQQGGLFTPAYGSRQALPEYLVLIDRASFADQQARLEDEIVRRLVQDNVFVDVYYFQGDPRLCRKQDPNSPYFSLHEIASLYPDHHLIVFSEGATFLSPLTGEPERWLDMFSAWPTKALMTPESPAYWGNRESCFAELGFFILPATIAGLAALTELLAGSTAARVESDQRTHSYPTMLRDRTTRWLENHEPQPTSAQRLCDQLKVFLGDVGYRWLSACAVYPMLYWDLTLYLGFKLFLDRSEIEARLLSLVRLPWFRYGSIPDWLRLRLINDLSRAEEAKIREVLEALFLTVMQQPAEGIHLDIATEEKKSAGFIERLRQRYKKWRLSSAFWQFMKQEPPESPMRDYVFLSFMAGRKPGRLTVSVPDTIHKLFFPQGQRALGMRPASLLGLALVGSAALFLVNWQIAKARIDTQPRPFYYAQMSEAQQKEFLRDKVQDISARLKSGVTTISDHSLTNLKSYIDDYVKEIDNAASPSTSGYDVVSVLKRAIPLAPTVASAFEKENLPRELGLYVLMIETNYRYGSNLNAFSQELAKDGANNAAKFSSTSADITLLIFCFDPYFERVESAISTLPSRDRNAWFLFDNSGLLLQQKTPEDTGDIALLHHLPRFFAAAIVGENPRNFRLDMDPLSTYTAFPTIQAEKIRSLISLFNTPQRRDASNRLLEIYPQYMGVLEQVLIDSIVSQSPESYLVNLYIARTLAMIQPNWRGTPEALTKLEALRGTQDYRDPIFKDRVDRAIRRYSEASMVTTAPTSVTYGSSDSTSLGSSVPDPPELQLNVSPMSAGINERLSISARLTPAIPGAQHLFNFGDGSSAISLNGRTSHVYGTEGSFLISVTVTHTRGRTSHTIVQRQPVNIGTPRILLSATPGNAKVGDAVMFTATSLSDFEASEYSFSFGDESAQTGWQTNRQAFHRYSSEGRFTGRVFVRGKIRSTGVSTEQTSFVFLNIAPR